MRNFFSILAGAAMLTLVLTTTGCGNDYVRTEGMVWNTEYHITYNGPESLKDSILPVLDRVSRSVSAFSHNSLVSRINRGETDQTDALFEKVFEASQQANADSHGMFDPTLSPIINAWGFGYDKHCSADTLRLDSLISLVGIADCKIENHRLTKKNEHTQFNFSAIAKGYGCDAVAAMMERNGVTDYLIEIGGEIRTGGVNPKGEKWNISIDRPVKSTDRAHHESECVVRLTDCGLATSGNYRNFRVTQFGLIYHTFSPKTGRPAETDIASATVVAPDAMTADAYATACMAMQSAEAMQMLDKRRLDGMLILSDSTIMMTKGFKKLLRTNTK